MPEPRSICWTCCKWVLYPYILGTTPVEGWRCRDGVALAGERRECLRWMREPGSDDE